MGFFTNLFKTNNNKKTTTEMYDVALNASSGSSFYSSQANIVKIPEFMSTVDMVANDIAGIQFNDTSVSYADNDTIRYNKLKKNSRWNLLLNKQPNDSQSSVEFWKTNIYNLFIRGGFFFYILKEKGKPKELIPINPNLIEKVKDANGKFYYLITLYNQDKMFETPEKITVNYEDVFSMYAFDLDYISDLEFRSVYSSLLEQLGLKNNYDLIQLNQSARILAHVKAPEGLNAEQKQAIKSSMKTFFTSAKDIKSSAVLVTDPKTEVELLDNAKTQIKSSVDKDFIENLMVKLANMFHIPLPKLNIVSQGQSYYKSREGVNIDYIADAIKPIAEKIISKLNALIYPNSYKNEFKFDINKLLMVDHATRAEYSSKMRQNAILTTNELRILNGLPPIAKDGDKLFGNGTLVELGTGKGNNNNDNEKGGSSG